MTSIAPTTAISTHYRAPRVRCLVAMGVEAACATPRFSEIGEREIAFLLKARQAVQKRADNRKKAEKRRQADDDAIEAVVNAMVEIIEDEHGDVNVIDRERVALAAEVPVNVVKRVWKDAVWYARDADGSLSVIGANRMSPAERERALAAMTHQERELRLAYHALSSPETVRARLESKEQPYSDRQKNLVRKDQQREDYHRLIADEPCTQMLLQSGWDRVNYGYHSLTTVRVGGATQPDGQGKYLQLPFSETGGFRSNTAEGATLKRVVASTPKVGARRRGRVTGKANVRRALYLDQIGKSYVEIAKDIGQSVQRVRATIWDNVNPSILRTGLTNDRRFVHLAKWAALDQVHGNLRVDCRDVFRIESDYDFADIDQLLKFISRRKVKPFLVVWVWDDSRPGVISHPHFLFALPEGSGIWYGERKAMAMLEAVAVEICADYGGDVGGLANMFDTKLPTSPVIRPAILTPLAGGSASNLGSVAVLVQLGLFCAD